MWPDQIDSQEESDYLVFQGKLPAQPRYTVELTTEGWQIKDNVVGIIEASAYGSKRAAEEECEAANKDSRRHD